MVKEVIDNQTGTCNGCRNCGAGCNCGGMHGYGGHPLLRILLALILLAFVFAAGMKLGELKAELGIGYAEHYMGGEMRMRDEGMDQGIMIPAGSMTTTTVAPAPATTTTAPVVH